MKKHNLRLVLAYLGGLTFIAVIISAFVMVNYNANLKHQAMTSNDMKVAVQPAPDSGLVMCQQMAERASMPGPKPKLSYTQVQARFELSQLQDVREAGVRLVQTLQRIDTAMSAMDDEKVDLGTSMGAVMALRIAWEDMQDACRKHGVDVPDLPS